MAYWPVMPANYKIKREFGGRGLCCEPWWHDETEQEVVCAREILDGIDRAAVLRLMRDNGPDEIIGCCGLHGGEPEAEILAKLRIEEIEEEITAEEGRASDYPRSVTHTEYVNDARCCAVVRDEPREICGAVCDGRIVDRRAIAYCDAHGGSDRTRAEVLDANLRFFKARSAG